MPIFSQYYEPSPLFSNPAWVAAKSQIFVGTNFRREQIGVRQGISSAAFELMMPFLEANNKRIGGFGLAFLTETAGKGGLLRQNALIGNLAYNLDFSDYDHLAFGLQGGYFFRRINPDLLTSESQYTINGFDANLPLNENFAAFQSDFPQVNTGFLWYGEDEQDNLFYYLSLAAYSLNKPTTTWFADVNRIPWLLQVAGEMNAFGYNEWLFYPTFRYVSQANKQNLSLGTIGRRDFSKDTKLGVGIWFNTNKKIISSIDIATKNYQFSVSYDLAFANRNVLGQTNSVVELSLLWKKPFERKSKNSEKIIKKTKKNRKNLSKDTTKTENLVRIDTNFRKKEVGEANRVEQRGKIKVIIREPLEIIAPKDRKNLSETEKELLKSIEIANNNLKISEDKIYQIAQMLFQHPDWKLKILLYQKQSDTQMQEQADAIREQLILLGVEPERLVRQNLLIENPAQKSSLEWVLLRK